MKVLVTGCAGFIGFHVTRTLLERGDEVVGIDNLNDYYDVSLKESRLRQLEPFTCCHPEQSEGSRSPRDSSPAMDQKTSWPQNDNTGHEGVSDHRSQITDHGPEGAGVSDHRSLITDHGPKRCGRFTFVKLDISNREAMEKLFAENRFERVIHLAAQAGVRYSLENPHAYVQSNVVGFLNVLESCRHHWCSTDHRPLTTDHCTGHLVYASSSSVYGLNTKLPFSTQDNVDHPISMYAATKRADEIMAYTYSHLYGLPATGLRFFTVYGPWGRPDMAYFKFTKAIAEGRPIDVYNNGKMRRDFTYIDDIVEGVLRVCDIIPGLGTGDSELGRTEDVILSEAKNPVSSNSRIPNPEFRVPYKLYNIGNHSPVALMDFISAIEEALGKMAVINYMPMQAGDVPETYADVEDLMRDVGFKPDTPIQRGISDFIDWYRSYYSIH